MEIIEENCLFNIDEFIQMYVGGDLKRYLEKIKNADDIKLKQFAKEIKKHKKMPQKINFARSVEPQGVQNFLIHDDILLKAIKWEFCKRSPLKMKIHNFVKSLRGWWWGLWFGADMVDNEYLGLVKKLRKGGKTLIQFIGLRQYLIELSFKIGRYIIKEHKWIIGILVLIGLAVYTKSS